MECSSKTEKIYGFDVHAGFEGNYGSVGYAKQSSLVWLLLLLACLINRQVEVFCGFGRHSP